MTVLEAIDLGVACGRLSRLNRAFARFLWEQEQNEAVAWLGALLSHQLDRGEVYLDLAKLARAPEATLAWLDELEEFSSEGVAALRPWLAVGLESWLSALRNTSLVSDGDGNTPLVLAGARLYLRRYWHYQQQVEAAIRQRLQPMRNDLPEALTASLKRLFPNSTEQPDWQKIACVLALRARFSLITGGPGTGKTTTLTKLLALLIQLRQSEAPSRPPTILLAAPTGKAAARVSESITKAVETLALEADIKQAIPRKASTLHRLLGRRPGSRQFMHHRHHPLAADVVIVDEASMIDLEMMAALLDALPPQALLVLLGDKDQLASVEAGAVMGELCRGAERAAYDDATRAWIGRYAGPLHTHDATAGSAINQQTVMLRYSHRFDEGSGIGQLARAVNAGDADAAQRILNATETYPDLLPQPSHRYLALRQAPRPDAADRLLKQLVTAHHGEDSDHRPKRCQGYGYYLAWIKERRPQAADEFDAWAQNVLAAFDTFQVLCALRHGPWGVTGLNQRIEAWLFPHANAAQWYEGRPVMITRNDYSLGLMNGDIGIALKDSSDKLRVVFPGTDAAGNAVVRWLSPIRLPDVETAYAITVHKSQGSEFDHVALVLPDTVSPVLTKELIYTGITRAKAQFTLVESGNDIFKQAILASCRDGAPLTNHSPEG